MNFDVFMIAYQERNAAENWARLQSLVPGARLIEGIPGIETAIAACAQASRTPFFFQVDADNWVLDGAGFAPDFAPQPDEVAFWRATNPVNGLAYWHGGIKLFSVASFAQARKLTADAPTSLGARNRYLPGILSEHRFNTDPETSWSVAFRECAKLAVSTTVGDRLNRQRAQAWLEVWCRRGGAAPHGRWAITGAREGRTFGLEHRRDPKGLAAINDYAWMHGQFRQRHVRKIAIPQRD